MKSDIFFEQLALHFKKTTLKGKVQFRIKRDLETKIWTVDLTNKTVTEGGDQADAIFVIDDLDMVTFAKGKTNLRTLFFRKKLYIEGEYYFILQSYAYAIKFSSDIFPKIPHL